MAQREENPRLRELLKPQAHLEFDANRQVLIEDCLGILEYSPELVRINAGDYILRFSGRDLQLSTMTQDGLLLKGHIDRLEFLY